MENLSLAPEEQHRSVPPRAALTFEAKHLDARAVAGAVKDYGVALVRGALSAAAVAPMEAEASRYIECLEDGQRTEEEQRFYQTYGNVHFVNILNHGEGAILGSLSAMVHSPFAEALFSVLGTKRISTPLGYDFVRRHSGADWIGADAGAA